MKFINTILSNMYKFQVKQLIWNSSMSNKTISKDSNQINLKLKKTFFGEIHFWNWDFGVEVVTDFFVRIFWFLYFCCPVLVVVWKRGKFWGQFSVLSLPINVFKGFPRFRKKRAQKVFWKSFKAVAWLKLSKFSNLISIKSSKNFHMGHGFHAISTSHRIIRSCKETAWSSEGILLYLIALCT